jgi:hypothetical protein
VVEDLHKEMDRLEVGELVVVHVHAHRKEESCIAPVDNLVRSELHVPPTNRTQNQRSKCEE